MYFDESLDYSTGNAKPHGSPDWIVNHARQMYSELSPETGRRHQLRRHLKHLAHPIIGDATYGKGKHNRLFADLFGCRRMLLACTALELTHPANGEPLSLNAPPSDDFMDVLKQLGWAQYVG